MGDKKVLCLRRNLDEVIQIEVDDTDLCNVLDIYIQLLEEAVKKGLNLPKNPSLWYVHNSRSHKLESDNDLLELFRLFHDKSLIKISIGSADTPCENLQLAMSLLESRMSSGDTVRPSSQHTIPSTGYMDETNHTPTPPTNATNLNASNENVLQLNHVPLSLQTRRIPKTSARRKGIYFPAEKRNASDTQPTSGSLSRTRKVLTITDGNIVGDVDNVDSDDEEYQPSDSSEEDLVVNEDGLVDEDDPPLAFVVDGYNPEKSNEWETDKDAYFDRLYENGEFHTDNLFGLIKIKLWMIFFDKEHLYRVLRDFCIQQGVAIVTQKSDSRRLTAACIDPRCEWRLHASKLPDGYTWAIKKLTEEHTCTRLSEFNPMATMRWAADKIMDDVKANPDISGKAINDLLKLRYGVRLKKTKVYETRKFCLEQLQGNHDTSYGKLPAYCEVLKSTNPDSKAHCAWKVADELPEKPLQFKNIFISLKPMIEGFRGCRSLIGVDGCHLKGKFGGVVLSAIAVDGNAQIFPLAYGVYENESKSTWAQFFWHLKDSLKDIVREDLTIISDRQKGIEPALDDIWPGVSRRLCCRHLCANFKKQYPGRRMHYLFWACCEAYSEFSYNKAVEMMQKEAGFGAVKWLHEAGKKEQWARHRFDPSLCNEENTSSFVESFNSTIGVDRLNPVLSLLEGIRRTNMVRYVKRQEEAKTWPSNGITPKIAKKLHKNLLASRELQVFQASSIECEVKQGRSCFPVNLNNRTCACGEWQISGIPCKHAVRAIQEIRTGVPLESYVSSWFSVQMYHMTYSVNFHPVPDEEQWPANDLPNIFPPTMKRGVGRPPRNRRREDGEKQKGKRSGTVRCSKCQAFGHNAKTCKGGLTARELREQQVQGQQGVRVEQRKRTYRKRKAQPPDEATSDVLGSAPWNVGSQHDT